MKAKFNSTSQPKSTKSKRAQVNQAEEVLREYQAILSTAEEVAKIGSWKWDLRTQKLTWSHEMFRLFGVDPENFNGDLSRVVEERIHPDDTAAVNEANRKVMEESDPQPMSYRIVLPDGTERTVWAQGKLICDEKGDPIALTGFVQDITERLRAENKIIQMKRLYATLSQVNQMIVRVKERDELFQTICNVSVQFGEFPLAWVGLLDESSGDVRPVASTTASGAPLQVPLINIHQQLYKDTLITTALQTSKVRTSENLQGDPRVASVNSQFQASPYHALAVIPFLLRGKPIGVLALLAKEQGIFKDEEEIRLLDEMGLDISFALDNMENEKERRQAEQKIAYQARLLENINDAVLATDSQFRITNWNHAAELLYGYNEHEVLGRRLQEVILSEFSAEQRASAIRDLQEDGSYRIEVLQYHRDGHCFWVDGSTFAIRDQCGRVDGYISVNRDITQRKKAEQQLRESEERLRLSLQAANQGFFDLNIQTGEAIVNRQYVEMLGYDYETFVETNESWIERLHPEDKQVTAQAYRDYIAGLVPEYRVEFRQRTGDGSWKWILSLGRVIEYDSQGKPLRMLGTHTDIDKRKKAEIALAHSHQLLNYIIEHNRSAVAIHDKEMNYIYVSERYLNDYGLRGQNVIGKHHYEVFPDLPQKWREVHRRVLNGEVLSADDDRYEKADGSVDWTRWECRPWYEPDGSIGGMIVYTELITERKKAEQILRESEERFSKVFKSSPNGIDIFDLETGRTVDVNDAFLEITGYSREEVIEHTAAELNLLASNETYDDWFDRFKQGEAVSNLQLKIRRKTGEIRDILASPNLIEVNGQPMMMVHAYDITERKHAEELVRRSERLLRLFVEHTPAAIAMFDRDMKYIVASRRYLIDYRLDEQDVTGRSHYEVFPEMPERWKEIHRRCLAGAIEKADEDPFPRQDGTLDWVRWEIRPWYEESGSIGGIILFSEVITERKNIQDELRLLNISLEQRVAERTAELEHANRIKDEFLANMSHELRTPLSSILGLSESLLEERRGFINEHQKRSLDVIHASGQHLLELINDILDLSKIEAGKLEYSPEAISVDEVCNSSLVFIKAQATKKSIHVTYDNQAAYPKIMADHRRLKQILVNLLSNAVKFTPVSGNVVLRVNTDVEQELIQFHVIDDGIGIAAQDLKKLFQPFVQVDSRLTRQYEGTGLGLALVQKLVDLHGGSIHVESEPGEGSRFTIQLSCSQEAIASQARPRPADAPIDIAESHPQPGPRGVILLAEDNVANVVTISEYLEDHGYQVIVAHDGAEAIQKAEEICPDIILMDIQMPVMNGFVSIVRLRSDVRFATTPIIALTGLAMAGDRERCLAAGASDYMSKPVTLKILLKRIAEFLQHGKG